MLPPAFTKVNKYIFDPAAYAWNLPSGFSCPAAEQCLAKADRKTGKVWNGPKQTYKCYSAVYERFPTVRNRVWANFDAVRGKDASEIAVTLLRCFPKKAKRVRPHISGDFYSQDYFDGWLQFIRAMPHVHFWAFTKSLPFWIKRFDKIPENFTLTASRGGKFDNLIEQHKLKSATVVYSIAEASERGLPLDTDDKLAAYGNQSFALMENFKGEKVK
tara:strand:+ start:3623 stop:4270 length:648 start_codon:yes stop_codon:yes gene_type:complete